MRKLFILLICAVWLCCSATAIAGGNAIFIRDACPGGSCLDSEEEAESVAYDEGQLLAWMTPAMVGGGTPAAGVSCLTGTYAFHWKPTYDSGDRTTACISNGQSTITGNQTGGTLTATSYLADDDGEHIEWTHTSTTTDIVTIFVRFKITTQNTDDQIYGMGGISLTSTTADFCQFRPSAADPSDVQGHSRSTLQGNEFTSPATTYTRGNWETVGVTYSESEGTNDFGACLGDTACDAGTFTKDSDNIQAWNADPDEVFIGDNANDTYSFATDDDVEIVAILIIEGFDATTISGWYD